MSEVVHLKPPSASGYCYCGHASCFQCSARSGDLRRMMQRMNRPKPVPAKLKVIELLYGKSGGDLADWLEGYKQAIELLKRECTCPISLVPEECQRCNDVRNFLLIVDADIERRTRCKSCGGTEIERLEVTTPGEAFAQYTCKNEKCGYVWKSRIINTKYGSAESTWRLSGKS